jgi:hypothetical protein
VGDTVIPVSISLPRALELTTIVAALFLAAWILSRFAERLATWLVDRSERSPSDASRFEQAAVVRVRQRETAIALIATSVRYAAFVVAVILGFVALSGPEHLRTIIGASFLAVVLAFAVQRFLLDIVAGLLMFFDGWFRIGDTVAVDPWNAQGVVEQVSLRALTLRTIHGEIVHIPNSQVLSLRLIPRGYREIEVEFFATNGATGRELVEQVARLVPVGPTRFLRRPEVVDVEELAADLHRVTASCAVAVGREWLAEDFLPSLMKERAAAGLLVHGPVVMFVDERTRQRFARSTARHMQPEERERLPELFTPDG